MYTNRRHALTTFKVIYRSFTAFNLKSQRVDFHPSCVVASGFHTAPLMKALVCQFGKVYSFCVGLFVR